MLLTPVLGHGQIPTEIEVLSQIVSLSKPVHFSDTEGKNLMVPPGAYWVTPRTETLELIRLEDGETYNIQATTGEHAENLAEPIALSTPGTDEQPDIHSVSYMYADGSQLVAEGSYSGIQARGVLGDAAKRKVAAARAAAQRAAAEAKRRAQVAAAEAQRRVEQAAAAVRRKARAEMGEMLQDIANAEAREGRAKAVAKAVRYAPRLAAMSTAALTPRQKFQLIQAARQELRNRMPFIKEVFRRATTIRPYLRDGRQGLSAIEIQTVRDAIFGSGENELRHPFAGPVVKTRGLGAGINPSWSIGASGDISGIAGFSIGAAQSFPLNLFSSPGTCTYVSAAFDLGAQEEADVSGNIGFYLGGHDTLGASSVQGWLDGFEVAVNLGAAYIGGVEVTLLFSIPSEDLAYIPLTGIQLGLAGGEAAEAAVAFGYGIRLACA